MQLDSCVHCKGTGQDKDENECYGVGSIIPKCKWCNGSGKRVAIKHSVSSEPLRWVENCKPDKPGIWAVRRHDGSAAICDWTEREVEFQSTTNTRCYLGPMPEILPPVMKVVERLWVYSLDGDDDPVFVGRWIAESETVQPARDWIRTDRTREVER